METDTIHSSFLQLPLEIRLEIYDYLLISRPPNGFTMLSYTDIEYEMLSPICDKRARGGLKARLTERDGSQVHRHPVSRYPAKTLSKLAIHTLDPSNFLANNQRRSYKRTTFYTRADRFRGRTMETTYWIKSEGTLEVAILQVNRQIHREAASVLYSRHLLDFDTHVDAVVPFINDLSLEARSWVRSVAITKRATPFEKEFDRLEWASACRCLGDLPALKELKLQVIASKPSREGWHGIEPIEKEEMRKMVMEPSFAWVGDLLMVKGLKKLDITAKIEKCMSPGSDTLSNWVRFSRSIQGSFQDVIRDMMVRHGSVGESHAACKQQLD